MHRNPSVNIHQFSMVPKPDVPRSAFRQESTHKTTFDGGYLIPVYLNEVLPGDSMNLRMTAFARLSTPLFPVMDNMKLTSFFFFVPYRIIWTNWKKFMGEQDSPTDSISYTIPQVVSKASGYDINSLQDYMGLPTLGQVTAAATVSHSTLPLRAYNRIWFDWFKDENLQNAPTLDVGDGPDTYTNYVLLRRGKRFDYFTAALPNPQKGTAAATIPLGTTAPVYGTGKSMGLIGTAGTDLGLFASAATGNLTSGTAAFNQNTGTAGVGAGVATDKAIGLHTDKTKSGMLVDLSSATAASINTLRSAIALQQLLEKNARGGTRYVEIILEDFGVRSPDFRLQRTEYLGGGQTPITVNPIAQTAPTGLTGATTPLGALGGMATTLARGHGFNQAFTEHGIVIGLICVDADLTYQQGIERFWNRSTRYDFYRPVFANLGEQTILNKEIYCKGDSDPNDAAVFGYAERFAEYRYKPNKITGLFRSTAASTIDPWHLAEKFTSLPTLAATFIQSAPPIERIVSVGSGAAGKQFLLDCFFQNKMARPMPLYSVPGLHRL